MSAATLTVAELEASVGRELGVSGWRTVDQEMIDRFADCTDDHQFIHVDPERARTETPFGGTVAHGFLTLSLLSTLRRDAVPIIAEQRMGVNYGFDRVRFVSPVRTGSRVRGRFVLSGFERRTPAQLMLRYGVTVEIDGEGKPALTAEWLTLAVLHEVA